MLFERERSAHPPLARRPRSNRIDVADTPLGDATPPSDDGVRVVVVDDEPDVADVLAEILEANGYQVRIAHDGLVALSVIEEYRPHCVLLDVNLPGMDGGELARRLRERYGDDLVLVAVTGWSESDKRVSNAFRHVDHYLQKPVDRQMLSRVLPPVR